MLRGEQALIDRFVSRFACARARIAPALGEGARPAWIRARAWPGQGALPFTRLGPGDDCAVLQPAPGEALVATVDALVEGVHFDLAWAKAEEIGHKALATGLSDVAAMGGVPRAFLVSIELPPARAPLVGALARGMARLAAQEGTSLAGGNFSRAEKLTLHVTVLGTVPRGRALTRAGARPGDLVFLSGPVGDAALGLRRLARAGRPRRLDPLSRAQLSPRPRIRAGLLAREGGASAAIDISDGLVRDLGHVARASGVAVRIDAARLPLSPAFVRAAKRAEEPLAAALSGGEDYALAFTVPPGRAPALARAFARAREPLASIGECAPGRGVRVLGPDGRPMRLPSFGWDHFA